MSYRDKDKHGNFGADPIEGRLMVACLFAPGFWGLFLLLTAERGSYFQIGFGALLLASAPFVARFAWKSYFPD